MSFLFTDGHSHYQFSGHKEIISLLSKTVKYLYCRKAMDALWIMLTIKFDKLIINGEQFGSVFRL